MNLPKQYTSRMEELLGDEYAAFLASYDNEKQQGLRVNTSKISVEDFLRITPFALTPIPWTANGFFYRNEDEVTKHPHYYAGLYYIQEPSAMVPASRLPVVLGDRVLDLCAAPGGKATELGAKLSGSGILVANDVSATRAKALLKNIERFGFANAYVTGEKPEQLLTRFGSFFDKILVDAPCSGEGMFRKDPSLIRSWEERGPEYYAPLQKEILSCAVCMLRPGGMLLYSTCTFSEREDENIIAQILETFPEMEMAQPLGYEGFAPGMMEEDHPCSRVVNENCIRIWPHRMEGEGHFAALLRKRKREDAAQTEPAESVEKEIFRERKRTGIGNAGVSKGGCPEAEAFLRLINADFFVNSVVTVSGEMVLLQPKEFTPPKLRYLRTGLLLGTVKRGRFEPSQALAMALRREQFPNVLDLPSAHEGVCRYLKGETLDIPEAERCAPGWVLICCDGYPLGWGKCVNGSIRNKYHPGWRLQ